MEAEKRNASYETESFNSCDIKELHGINLSTHKQLKIGITLMTLLLLLIGMSAATCYAATINVISFEDLDGDGLMDFGEPGLENWEITVTCGIVQATKLTDINGYAGFTDLPAGACTVSETNKSGWRSTTPDSINVILALDSTATVYFGNRRDNPATINVISFEDLDGDGVMDAGEPGLSNWSISLYIGSGCNGSPLASSLTNADGMVVFTLLSAGDYSVSETMQAGWQNTTDLCQNISLETDASETVYFGNHRLFDFGDAPDPVFSTLAASNGARHILGGGVYLGTGVDAESDGQPSAGADGDDTGVGSPVFGTLVNNDDEDGVIFKTALSPGATAQVDVTASAACILSAWIDFNADGDWADIGEDLFPGGKALAAGVNNLTFAVPTGATLGTSYARFRCTTDGALPYTGLAPDGEVEDYYVTIEAINAIPTLNEWGMIIFSLLIGSFAIWYTRKKAHGVKTA